MFSYLNAYLILRFTLFWVMLSLWTCELGILQPAEDANQNIPRRDSVEDNACSTWGGGYANGKAELDLPGFLLTAPIPEEIPAGYDYFFSAYRNHYGIRTEPGSVYVFYEDSVGSRYEWYHDVEINNALFAISDNYLYYQPGGIWSNAIRYERQNPMGFVSLAVSSQSQTYQVVDTTAGCGAYYVLLSGMGSTHLAVNDGDGFSRYELVESNYVRLTTIYSNETLRIALYDNERHGLDIADATGRLVETGIGLLPAGEGIDLAADSESIYTLTKTEESYFIHRVFLAGGVAEEVLTLEPVILSPKLFMNNKRLYIRFALPGESPKVYQVR